MSESEFKAFYVEETGEKQFSRSITTRSISDLPEGDVLVRVQYSGLNFKDALSSTGNKGVTRNFPHTPGIDAAGVVAESSDPAFNVGDEVIVTSYDLGMNTSGGLGQYIRVPAGWVIPLPKELSAREAMIFGTGGLTAGLMIDALVESGVKPTDGPILVSGATGGVGSMAVAILATIGYQVVATSGKPADKDFLTSIGASEVISREDAVDDSSRPMLKEQWAGVVDVVGGKTLATALKATKHWGVVTCCGLVGSPKLETSVFPFILRGVRLIGIDSAECPMEPRLRVWNHLASDWKPANLDAIATEIGLEEVEGVVLGMLEGKSKGRTIVDLG